jgi:hypothetical protein
MSDDAWFAENPEAEAIAERAGTYDGDRRIFIAARDILTEEEAENERLRAELDKLPIADLLRYPAPFRVTLFVDTLEIRDCNGSICPPSIASTVAQCLNVCRAAADAARNNGPEGGE